MATIDNQFHHSTTEQDFTATGEVDIRKLEESAPGQATFQANHPNAAGTTQITLDPYTNRSTQGDIRANAGWAINRLGADGMVSTSTEKRIIPSGTWTFTMGVSAPVAGTLTGTLTVSFIVAVYRVSSSGARTQLFTATSNTGQSTGLGALAQTTLTATSSQSEFTLEADETIHVGYISNCVQVAGTLGATVAGNITWYVGAAGYYVQVPSPGIRTHYLRSTDVIGTGTVTRDEMLVVLLERSVTGVGTATHSKLTEASKTFSVTGIGTATESRSVQAQRTFSLTGTGTVTRQLAITPTSFDLTSIGTAAYSRAVVAAKTFSLTGIGTVTIDNLVIEMAHRSLTGIGTITETHPVQAFRTFSLVGKGEILNSGTNGSTITIPIDEVPTEGGGGTTVVRRTMVIFDD